MEDLEELRRLIRQTLSDSENPTLYDVWKGLSSRYSPSKTERILQEIAKEFLKTEIKRDLYVFERVLFRELEENASKKNRLIASLIKWMIRFLKGLEEFRLNSLQLKELRSRECSILLTLEDLSEERGGDLPRMIERSFKGFSELVGRIYECLEKREFVNLYLIYVRAVKVYFNLITLLSALNLKEITEELKKDPLTGLLNRRYMGIILRDVLELSQYSETPFSVAILDIDNFKEINDTYGHLVGDCILRELGKLLREFFRKGDYIFRYGGEEFLIIMPSTSLEEALKLLTDLKLKIQNHTFLCRDAEVKLTVSIGLCSDVYRGDKEPFYYVKCADIKLYRAKKTGKNKVIA
ncbi:MAG: GGDEF domain-containing protein [Aquificae bacterium]|nr:GGDEF domain-containing protein [Aquificota bacterium]